MDTQKLSKEEIQAQYITKKAAAFTVSKEAKVSRAMCISGIISNFLVAVSSYYNIVLGVVSSAFVVSIFAYFLYISHKRVVDLKHTYSL